jgi:hypothetical protein
MLVSILSRLFGKKSSRRPAPKPPRRCLGLEQLEARDCPSPITLIASGQWSNPSIWLNTDTMQHTVPTSSDDVTLTSNYSVQAGGTGLAVHSLKLDSNYTGALELWGALNVNPNGDSTGGLEVDNGTLDQPGGANAPVNVQGFFNWSAGLLNNSGVHAALNLLNGTATLTGNNLSTGSDITVQNGSFIWSGNVLDSITTLSTLHLIADNTVHVIGDPVTGNKATGVNFDINGTEVSNEVSGTWTFNKNAGISLSNAATFEWNTNTGSIATSGTGIIMNSGGIFSKTTNSGTGVASCGLPYVNNDPTAGLFVYAGTLKFTGAGATNGVSVLQNSGDVYLESATLEVDHGLTMNNGMLETSGNCDITGGDVVRVHGGRVTIDEDSGTAALYCDGAVTMDGGEYLATVDETNDRSDLWYAAKGFTIGGTATLTVKTVNILDGGLPPGRSYTILQTLQTIVGDFATKNLAMNDGSGNSFTTSVTPDQTKYQLNS